MRLGLPQTARTSGSGNGFPNRGNDLLGPASQRGSGRSIRRSAIDETGRAMIQHGQQEIAGKIFTALESAGRWRAVYIDDMQKVLDTYDPAQ